VLSQRTAPAHPSAAGKMAVNWHALPRNFSVYFLTFITFMLMRVADCCNSVDFTPLIMLCGISPLSIAFH